MIALCALSQNKKWENVAEKGFEIMPPKEKIQSKQMQVDLVTKESLRTVVKMALHIQKA